MGVLLDQRPPSSLSADSIPPLFERFIGTIPLSDSSRTCARGVRLFAFPHRPTVESTAGVSEVSRFSCVEFLDVHGVYDYAGPVRNSRYRS
jgi:hypothetical protein